MIVHFKGEPKELRGRQLNVGDRAPDFTLTGEGMKRITLDDVLANGTKNALIIAVPSLDTGVCSLEAQTFNRRFDEFPSDTAVYVVSMDLPFAQTRWAKERGDVRIAMASDFRDRSFGPSYGILIEDLGLLARANFLIAKDKRILYKEIVPEVTNEPNYDDAVAAASRASSAVNA